MIPLPGNEGRSEGAHDAGDIRTDGVAAGNLLKASEYRVVVEGSALDYHMGTQVRGLGNFDYLEQGVLDDGVGQSRGNVRHGSALLLSLLDVGVHEHGAAGAQVRGVLRKEGLFGEILNAVIQALGKGLDKGAAAGGAGFI